MTGSSQVQEGPGEVGRCGHKALQVLPQWGAQVFCRLPAGHVGWHRGDDDSEWTNDAAPVVADRDIPEEMVETGAQGMATACGRGDIGTLPKTDQEYFRSKARAVLSAALAGRTVVDLPEPDAHREEHCRAADIGHADVEWHDPHHGRHWLVTASRHADGSVAVSIGGTVVDPDHAEARGLMQIAAAREARRLASGSGVGDQP